MVDKREALESWSEVWGALPSGKRWNLGFAAVGFLAGAVLLGYVVRGALDSSELHSTALDYKRQLFALERENASLKGPSATERDWMLSRRAPLKTVPALAEALLDETRISVFRASYREHVETQKDRTQIQTPDFHGLYAGKKYVWQGWVEGVQDAGDGEIALKLMEVDFSPIREPFRVECLFDSAHRAALEKLNQSDLIEVTGVMDGDGRLRRCRFVRIEPHRLEKAVDWKTG